MNRYKLCIQSARKQYPETKIVIIDDYSTYDIKKPFENDKNIIIEKAKLKRAGEINPYYHYFYNKYFDVAIIIQDSTTLKKQIPINILNTDINFFYYFSNHRPDWNNRTFENVFNTFYNNVSNVHKRTQLKKFSDNRYKWFGCMGIMSVISHEYLSIMDKKTNFIEMCRFVKNRTHRMVMECIFAVCCYYSGSINLNTPSINPGNFSKYYNRKLKCYDSELMTKHPLKR